MLISPMPLEPKDWGIGEIRIGNQYVYNSLEEITSSRFITFMERAAYRRRSSIGPRRSAPPFSPAASIGRSRPAIYGAPVGEVD